MAVVHLWHFCRRAPAGASIPALRDAGGGVSNRRARCVHAGRDLAPGVHGGTSRVSTGRIEGRLREAVEDLLRIIERCRPHRGRHPRAVTSRRRSPDPLASRRAAARTGCTCRTHCTSTVRGGRGRWCRSLSTCGSCSTARCAGRPPPPSPSSSSSSGRPTVAAPAPVGPAYDGCPAVRTVHRASRPVWSDLQCPAQGRASASETRASEQLHAAVTPAGVTAYVTTGAVRHRVDVLRRPTRRPRRRAARRRGPGAAARLPPELTDNPVVETATPMHHDPVVHPATPSASPISARSSLLNGRVLSHSLRGSHPNRITGPRVSGATLAGIPATCARTFCA
ncbi:hypothetical protein DC74_p00008 (plasmid) [Streptomyces noursei]|nr:hypothetical protein DC74_p00008 [Streptomyces noursei]